MRKQYLALAILLALCVPSYAQTPAPAYSGAPINRSTLNSSVVITTGNTFQTVLASNFGTTTQRQALTIENNNTNGDSCWISFGIIGGATITVANAAKASSILLSPGGSYTRYWPFVPSDAIQATCTTTNDTLYVDAQ